MAVIFIEGFDLMEGNGVSMSSMLTAGEWLETTGGGPVATTGFVRTSTAGIPSRAAYFRTLQNDSARLRLATDYSTLVAGFGWYKLGVADSQDDIFRFEYNTGSQHRVGVQIARDTNNAFLIKNGAGSTIATSSANTFSFNTWQFLELKARPHVTNGAVWLRVNDKEVISVDGSIETVFVSTTGTARYNQIRFEHADNGSAGRDTAIDDFYIVDTTGADNNDFLGQVGVFSLAITADGSTTAQGGGDDWAVGAGATNRWSAVKEDPKHDGDTSYIRASVVGDLQFFNINELPPEVTNVYAVKNTFVGRKDTSGANSISLPMRLAGTNVSSDTKTIDTAYAIRAHTYDKDPSGAAWTPAKVSALQIGIQIVSTT
jgi:hypothetical protein